MENSVRRRRWFWAAQSLSIGRVILTFAFVVLSPFVSLWPLTAALYLCALLTDFFDGQLARKMEVVSKFGGAMDVFGDRYFLVVSCLYVGFRGVSFIPLSIILARELYSVAMRMVQIDGKGIMMQNTRIGGIVHSLIALGTVGFIVSPQRPPSSMFAVPFYAIAVFYLLYFPYSVYKSRKRINASIVSDLECPSAKN